MILTEKQQVSSLSSGKIDEMNILQVKKHYLLIEDK